MYSSRGFTLIEVVITVAIIAALFTSSVPIFQKLQIRNDMNTAVATAAQAMRRAQTLSQSGTSDTTFGVYLQAGSITVFRGTSYAARDQAVDEVYTTSSTLTVSGLSEVVFAQLSGFPDTTGTTTFTTSRGGGTITISINERGTITY